MSKKANNDWESQQRGNKANAGQFSSNEKLDAGRYVKLTLTSSDRDKLQVLIDEIQERPAPALRKIVLWLLSKPEIVKQMLTDIKNEQSS